MREEVIPSVLTFFSCDFPVLAASTAKFSKNVAPETQNGVLTTQAKFFRPKSEKSVELYFYEQLQISVFKLLISKTTSLFFEVKGLNESSPIEDDCSVEKSTIFFLPSDCWYSDSQKLLIKLTYLDIQYRFFFNTACFTPHEKVWISSF